jgi:hypothetical protein
MVRSDRNARGWRPQNGRPNPNRGNPHGNPHHDRRHVRREARRLDRRDNREYRRLSRRHRTSFPTSPIVMQPDFDEAKLGKVTIEKHNHGKKTINSVDPNSKESVLFCVDKFDVKASELGFTPKEKVSGLLEICDSCLGLAYHSGLDTLGINLNGNVTAAHYNALKAFLIRSVFDIRDRSALIDYLTKNAHLRPLSPGTLTRHYLLRLRLLRKYAGMMPGIRALPTPLEMKLSYFDAQPPTWKAACLTQHNFADPCDIPEDDIVAFMEGKQAHSPLFRPLPTPRHRFIYYNGNYDESSDSDNSAHSRDSHDSTDNGFDRPHDPDNDDHGGGGGGHHRRQLGTRYVCPVHGPSNSHDWSHCICNPVGPNFDPEAPARIHARVMGRNSDAQTTMSPPANNNNMRAHRPAAAMSARVSTNAHLFDAERGQHSYLPDEAIADPGSAQGSARMDLASAPPLGQGAYHRRLRPPPLSNRFRKDSGIPVSILASGLGNIALLSPCGVCPFLCRHCPLTSCLPFQTVIRIATAGSFRDSQCILCLSTSLPCILCSCILCLHLRLWFFLTHCCIFGSYLATSFGSYIPLLPSHLSIFCMPSTSACVPLSNPSDTMDSTSERFFLRLVAKVFLSGSLPILPSPSGLLLSASSSLLEPPHGRAGCGIPRRTVAPPARSWLGRQSILSKESYEYEAYDLLRHSLLLG